MAGFKKHAIVITAVATVLSGCTTATQDGANASYPHQKAQHKATGAFAGHNPCSNNDRNIGMVFGAIMGVAAAKLMHANTRTAVVGGMAGAGLGAVIGHAIDQRRCNLYKIAEANNLQLASAPITSEKLGLKGGSGDVGLDVQMLTNSDEFIAGTATPTPEARKYLSQIAQQYVPQNVAASSGQNLSRAESQQVANRKVLIVAHTAATDDPAYAADLSEKRARAVAEIFAEAGVPATDIYYQGAGNALPIASNATAEGQAENRRVQIVDLPDTGNLSRYLQLRAPNPAYFAAAAPQTPAPDTSVTKAAPAPLSTPKSGRRQVAEKYDFGGAPVAAGGNGISLGAPRSSSMFDIVPSANAATPVRIQSCLQDTPHISTVVKNLATGQDFAPRDYVAGFDNAVWTANVNGNLVAILGATVPQDTGAPVPTPKVMVYRHYAGNKQQKPNFDQAAAVNVYRGSEKIVYRLFVNGPAKCIDLVVPTSHFAGQANLYYVSNDVNYMAVPVFAKH